MKDMKENQQVYDIIGDIHGHAHELEALLNQLGYREVGTVYQHPKGRKVVFLGDYIDGGPEIRRVLQVVRAMIDAGEALGIMGNHELNALRYHTENRHGAYMRAHYGSKKRQHQATLDQFGDPHQAEWFDYLEWFATLPLAIDLGHIRVAHACWHPDKIQLIQALGPLRDATLEVISEKGKPLFNAIEIVLCGLETKLPEGEHFKTADGQERDMIRIRWWEDPQVIKTNDRFVFPSNSRIGPSDIAEVTGLPEFSADSPITFFGHYAVFDQTPQALKPNLACLDYGMSKGKGGQLVAYSWDGESSIDPDKFTAIKQFEECAAPL
jgi:hypothetical protein